MITHNAKALAAHLRTAASALPSASHIPIFEYVAIGNGKVIGIGPEWGVQINVPEIGCDEICIHASVIPAIEAITGDVSVTDGKIKWDGGYLSFPGTVGYPTMPANEAEHIGTVDGRSLSNALKAVGHLADDSIDAHPFRLVWIDLDTANVYGCGNKHSGAMQFEGSGEAYIGLSKPMASKLAGLVASSEEVIVSSTGNSVIFSWDGMVVSATKYADKMPPMPAVLAKTEAANYLDTGIDPIRFLPILKTIQTTLGSHAVVSIDFAAKKLTSELVGFGKKIEQSIEGSLNSGSISLPVISALVHFPRANKILWAGEQMALYFTGPGYRGLSMPMMK